jgi:hypothetical protein
MARLVALVLASVTAAALPETRALSFPAFIVVFLFGVFSLRPREYAACWVVAMVGGPFRNISVIRG